MEIGGETAMGLKLVCGDLGVTDCPYVIRGENTDELMADVTRHLKGAHGYKDKKTTRNPQ